MAMIVIRLFPQDYPGHVPFRIREKEPDGVITVINWHAQFAFEPEALLHPDGVKGIYSIVFKPEGLESFTSFPEPGKPYTVLEARERVQKLVGLGRTNLYLKHRLFSQSPDKIGF